MNDQRVASFHFQYVVDPLKSRKPTDCKYACFGGGDSLRFMCNVLGSDSHILRIEGTARTVDPVTHFEAADAGSNGGDCAGAIRSQDSWVFTAVLRVLADSCFPNPNACSVHGYQDFARAELWNR